MSTERPPRFRVCVYQLHDGKTTKVIDDYGSGFITATATLAGDHLEVQFREGETPSLVRHIAAAIADEHSPRRKR